MRTARVLVLALAAVLVASLTGAAPAGAALAPAAPAVGSCHWLTWAEANAASDSKAPVDCSVHNTETIAVPQLPSTLTWADKGPVARFAARRCEAALVARFGGRAKAVQMSAYGIYWFEPTAAERQAGARWLRCDLAYLDPRTVPTLSSEPTLGALPLSDSQARCRKGKAYDYAVTRCVTSHAFRATHAVKYPGTRYPGYRKLQRWTIRKCMAKLPRKAFYFEVPYRLEWKIGVRHSICLKQTKG